MKTFLFTKMHSARNDFVIVDNRSGALEAVDLKTLAQKICDRRTGVGSDGLVILEPDPEYLFFMRFLNPDGSEAFCGNGSLCIADYAVRNKIAPAHVKFGSPWGALSATVDFDTVALAMPRPTGWHLNLTIDGETGHSIDTGAPHTVIFVDDIERVDVVSLGRKIRFHRLFAPAGTNVDFTQVVSDSKLRVRTYERGVENETFSCGSGATAAAGVGFLVKGLESPLTCSFQGGDLTIDFKFENGAFENVLLKSQPVTVFEGTFHYPA